MGAGMEEAADSAILIARLQSGASMAEAAREAGLSRRTAHRRLASLRDKFGVVNNAQLLRRVGAHQAVELPGSSRASESEGMSMSDDEIIQLTERLRAHQSLVVLGAAGVGRSTLLWMCAERLGAPVFAGAGLSSLQWVSYLSLISAVGRP